MKNFTGSVAMTVAALAITACTREATGQVAAVVNGEEVTLSELNGELAAFSQAGGSKEQIRAAALQSLIDRKLLVQQAKERGIDKGPEFLQQRRRNEDMLLVQLYAQELTKNVKSPDAAAIDRYIASNPQITSGRVIYNLDQVTFPQPADPSTLKQFQPDKTLDDVMRRLKAKGIQYTTSKATLDSAVAQPALVKQIAALPPGEPLLVGGGGRIIVSVVTGKQEQPLPIDAARALAAQTIQREQVSELARKQVEQSRASAEIKYQTGFAPQPRR